MRDAQRIEGVAEVAVADVLEEDRLRPVSDSGVEALLSSIEDLGGITDPIHVRKAKHRGGALILMAGGHRLEAARRLEWTMIPAVVWDCTDDWAMLKEIDDNAAGAELTPLDTAVFLAERKRVYERLHPETKRGGDRRSDQTDTMSVWSFARATAEKFGLTDRHVRRLVAAGDRLDPRDRQLLRRSPQQVALRDLMEISKIEGPAERYHVVEALSTGSARNAKAARKAWAAKDAPTEPDPDPVDVERRRLEDAWTRARKIARRRFVETYRDEIEEMLRGPGDDGSAE